MGEMTLGCQSPDVYPERRRNLPKKTAEPGEKFPKGMKVKLISGGPIMAVNGHAYDGDIQCVWFSGKKLEHGEFSPETLVPVTDEDEEKT